MSAPGRRRALARDVSGVAAVEFAILAVPLCVCLLGMIDAGYYMYVRSDLQGVLNDVARQATVQTPNFTGTGTLDQKIDNAIQTRMGSLVRSGSYSITKSSYYKFSSVGKPEKLIKDVNGNGKYDTGDCFQDDNGNGVWDTDSGKSGPGGADDVVVYTVTLTISRIVPMTSLIGLPANYAVVAKTTVHNQPYANQAAPAVVC